MTRRCGPCTQCCTAMRVIELDKPAGVRCRYLGPRGCTIYDERPDSCRAFACAWLQRDVVPNHLRPDKSGVVIGCDDSGQIPVLYVDPRRPRAHLKGKFGRYLAQLPAKVIPVFTGDNLTYFRRQK